MSNFESDPGFNGHYKQKHKQDTSSFHDVSNIGGNLKKSNRENNNYVPQIAGSNVKTVHNSRNDAIVRSFQREEINASLQQQDLKASSQKRQLSSSRQQKDISSSRQQIDLGPSRREKELSGSRQQKELSGSRQQDLVASKKIASSNQQPLSRSKQGFSNPYVDTPKESEIGGRASQVQQSRLNRSRMEG